jgi:hypothetical protein
MKEKIRTKSYEGDPVYLRARSGHRIEIESPRSINIHPEIITVLYRAEWMLPPTWLVVEVSTGYAVGEGKTRAAAVDAARGCIAAQFGGEELGAVERHRAKTLASVLPGPVIPGALLPGA